MDAPRNQVEASVVSVWEVAIKHRLDRAGNAAVPLSGTDFLQELGAVGLTPLPVAAEHVIVLDQMPLHHRDPFDRLLVAQAQSESMHLLTRDDKLAAYGDFVLVV